MEKFCGRLISGSRRCDGLDGLAERNLGLGADHHEPLLVLALDLARSELRLNHHHVLDRQCDAARGVDHHVVDVRHLLAVFLLQADDDRIFVATLAELRGHRPCHVRSNRVGDLRRIQAEKGCLGPVHLHGELGTRFVTRESRVRDAGRRLKQVLHLQSDSARRLEIFAADFDAHAGVVALPARHQAIDLVVATAGVGADDDARNARPTDGAGRRQS